MAKDVAATDADQIESVRKLPGTAWQYLFGRAIREFTRDGCMDLAAALTYRSLFAMFPALLALVSILGLVGQAESTTAFMIDAIKKYGSPEVAKALEPMIAQLADGQGAGLAFAIGVLGAIWTASNYVVSFGRAMNKVYDTPEGRSPLVLRPAMYLLTLGVLLGAVLCVGILVFSGSVATTIGNLVGLGEQSLTIWGYAKWPVLIIIVILMIASLYYFTPNVRRERFPWLSIGAVVALLVLALATAGFGWYLANFANYNKTYGTIGGLIALMLWLWIANSVLLFGAEVDAETERAKQLQSGLKAEEELQLPPRSTVVSKKQEIALARDVQTGRELRAMANPIGPDDIPPRHGLRWALGIAAGFVALLSARRRLNQDAAMVRTARREAREQAKSQRSGKA